MATHIFECRMLDGHLLANINGRAVVIDTGSESSYWRHLDNGHEALELQGEPMPYELADALERNVAPRLFGLMGMDNMRQFDVTISFSERTMSLHRESFFMPGAWSVPVEISHGSIPVIRRVGINGQARDVKFDLGARFSYLEFTGIEDLPGYGFAWGFLPPGRHPERFTVRLHSVNCRLASREFPLVAGNCGDVDGPNGINLIGSEVLKYFDVNISMRCQAIEFRPDGLKSWPMVPDFEESD